jgi:hypothetical protein
MIHQILGPRKRRTRQHVIADLGVHHVEQFILEVGHTCQRLHADYGYDLVMFTYDDKGYLEPGLVFIQVKAREKLQSIDNAFVFDLDIRDYNLWTREEWPIVLILFDVASTKAFWLPVQRYFLARAERPRKGAKTVRVRLSPHNTVNADAIKKMRELKWEALD